MKEHYLLGEVARVLSRKPHHLTHAIVSGHVPEPTTRIANKRLFTAEDVGRLARHFRVSPNWDALRPVTLDVDADPPVHLTFRPPYEVTRIGETGHQITDANGEVFAWTNDRAHALVMAGLLEAAAQG